MTKINWNQKSWLAFKTLKKYVVCSVTTQKTKLPWTFKKATKKTQKDTKKTKNAVPILCKEYTLDAPY